MSQKLFSRVIFCAFSVSIWYMLLQYSSQPLFLSYLRCFCVGHVLWTGITAIWVWSFFHLFWMPCLIWRLGKWAPPLILLMWYFASPLCTEVSFPWPLFKLLVKSYLHIIDGSRRVLEQNQIIGYNNGRSRFRMSRLVQIKDLLLIHVLGTPTGIRLGKQCFTFVQSHCREGGFMQFFFIGLRETGREYIPLW